MASLSGSYRFIEKGLDMPEAEEDVKYLIQIVKKDIKIQEKRRFLEDAPAKIKEIEKKIKKIDEELKESSEKLEKLEKEKIHLDMEIKSQNDKIERKKEEQRNVNSNKEYRAINTEIEYMTRVVDKDEERVLAILDEMEAVKKELAVIEKKIADDKSKLLEEKRRIEEEAKKSEDDLKILEDEKVRILPHISEPVRNLYERILKAKGDSGVANLVGDVCQGCFSRIPPQKAHEVRKNNQIIKCEVCGRILVYYPLDDSNKS